MSLRIKPSKQTVMVLGVVAFAFLLVCGFTYHNRASKLSAISVEIEDRQAKLEDSKQIASKLSMVEQNYLDAEAKLAVLEQGVSDAAYVPTLLRQLEELGRKVNLRVVGVRPRPVQISAATVVMEDGEKSDEQKEQPKPYDELSLDIELNGYYWDVVRFLEEVTCFPKIVTVNDIQLNPLSGQVMDMESPTLSVRLNATAFILKESDSAKAKDAAQRAEADNSRS